MYTKTDIDRDIIIHETFHFVDYCHSNKTKSAVFIILDIYDIIQISNQFEC